MAKVQTNGHIETAAAPPAELTGIANAIDIACNLVAAVVIGGSVMLFCAICLAILLAAAGVSWWLVARVFRYFFLGG